jgi:peptide deformylase
MALRELIEWNDPIFRKTSRAVEQYDERLWTLLGDMRDTLKKVGGYGCAAVHIGVLRRAVVINDESGVIELINPSISETSEATQNVREGSIAPGSPQKTVTRPKTVTVSAFDRSGSRSQSPGAIFSRRRSATRSTIWTEFCSPM